jgi:hypothetical protein
MVVAQQRASNPGSCGTRCGKAANGLGPATDGVGAPRADCLFTMYARAVDDAAERLRDLRREGWADLGLAVLVLGLAIGATQVHPRLALPLLIGGLLVLALGVRALWRRWELVEHLAAEGDAYVIAEVRAYASRETSLERRQSFAALIRSTLELSTAAGQQRLLGVADELEELASELEDDDLTLDPACAVACQRLLSDPGSPLFDPAVPPGELRWRIRRIRSGFRPHRLAA